MSKQERWEGDEKGDEAWEIEDKMSMAAVLHEQKWLWLSFFFVFITHDQKHYKEMAYV